MGSHVRLAILFAGHVQGVGFRYTARNLARNFDVTGYVRNLPDGRVEMVVEGEPEEARGLLEAIQLEMQGHVRETQLHEAPATGEFPGFVVRH
jgi:acylphosphatase